MVKKYLLYGKGGKGPRSSTKIANSQIPLNGKEENQRMSDKD